MMNAIAIPRLLLDLEDVRCASLPSVIWRVFLLFNYQRECRTSYAEPYPGSSVTRLKVSEYTECQAVLRHADSKVLIA